MALSLLVVVAAFDQAAVRTYVLEQGLDGFAGFEDTSIYSENENSGGGNDGIFSGTNQQLRDRRALIRVDVSFIPQDATVLDAQLQLTVERSGGNFGEFDYTLHRLVKEWGEGDVVGGLMGGFGGPAEPGDATWVSNKHMMSLWDTPGGDFVSVASATAAAGRQDSVAVWSGPGLASDVQGWIENPSDNFGWIVISAIEGEQQRVKKFFSSEALTSRPRLTITVDIPLGPPGALGVGDASTPAVLVCLIGLVGIWSIALGSRPLRRG